MISATSQTANPIQLDFRKIDLPQEAVLCPLIDGLTMSLNRGTANVDQYVQNSPVINVLTPDSSLQYSYQGRVNFPQIIGLAHNSQHGIRFGIDHPGKPHYQGNIGNSKVDLKASFSATSMHLIGMVGAIAVDISYQWHSHGRKAGKFMTIQGNVGGKEYKQEISRITDTGEKAQFLSQGKLGEKNFIRITTQVGDHSYQSEGKIGDLNFRLSQR